MVWSAATWIGEISSRGNSRCPFIVADVPPRLSKGGGVLCGQDEIFVFKSITMDCYEGEEKIPWHY